MNASRAEPHVRLVGRALLIGACVGAAAAIGSAATCAAVGGAAVFADALLFARRRALAVTIGLVVLAAAASGPALASVGLRDALLAMGAASLVVTAWRAPRAALLALVILAPVHTLVLSVIEGRWLLDPGALGMWKDVLVGTLCARAIVSGGRAPALRRADQPERWLAALVGLAMGVTVVSIARREVGIGLAARGLAADFGPLLLYPLARSLGDSGLDFARVRRLVVWMGAGLAIFGFVQLVVLGPSWYGTVGYFGPRDFKVPGHEHFRLSSVFLDPLPAGLLLAVAALLALDELGGLGADATSVWSAPAIRGLALFAVCALGCVATFTRSAWLGLAVGAIGLARVHRGASARAIRVALILAALATLPIVPSVLSWTRDTATRAESDTSFPHHLDAWSRGVREIADHPSGLGPGRAGEVSVRVLGASGIVTESSYLQFGVEYGVAGLLLVAGWTIALTLRLWRAARAGEPGAAGVLAAWAPLAIGALFLHALTERSVAYPVLLLAGASQRSRDAAREAR